MVPLMVYPELMAPTAPILGPRGINGIHDIHGPARGLHDDIKNSAEI